MTFLKQWRLLDGTIMDIIPKNIPVEILCDNNIHVRTVFRYIDNTYWNEINLYALKHIKNKFGNFVKIKFIR